MSDKFSSDLEVFDLSIGYRRKKLLQDASLRAERGDCVGILGTNGAGKSSLLRVLAGMQSPRRGILKLFGEDLLRHKKRFSSLIGYLPQENPLMEDLTVRDNLRLWYGKHIDTKLPVLTELSLTELLPLKVSQLSGGMKRRLSIACCMSRKQPVMLLDEPTAALDLHQKQLIRQYIQNYTHSGNIAILSTHDEEEIRMCSRLYYLKGSSLVSVDIDEAVSWLREGIQ